MRFVKRVVIPVAGVLIGVYCLGELIDAVDPIVIRVGMPWSEAEPALDRVAYMTGFSSLAFGSPINEDTGHVDYHASGRFILFPNNQCLCIHLRAPYSDGPRDQRVWHIEALELGPPFRGYGGKFAWLDDNPKTYPESIELGRFRWFMVVSWAMASILSTYIGYKWLRSIGKTKAKG